MSVSFDRRDYVTLCAVARRRDVSVAWIVRQAVQQLIRQEQETTENPELPLGRHGPTTGRPPS